MKETIKAISLVFAIVFLLFGIIWCGLTGFGKKIGVTLEQESSRRSYVEGTKYVGTSVWVRDFFGFSKSIEYSNTIVVKDSQVDSALIAERIKALPTYQKVKAVFNGGEKKEEGR